MNGTRGKSAFAHALVVDDDAAFLRNLAKALRHLGVPHVAVAESSDAALTQLGEGVDLLLCDLCLGADNDNSQRVLDGARRLASPPTVIAMSGAASRQQVFGLTAQGVSDFLDKPFDLAALAQCLERASDADCTLAAVARTYVGRVGAKEAQRLVRSTMFRQALEMTDGNRHAAARLLRVDRRLVQLMASELEALRALRPGGESA